MKLHPEASAGPARAVARLLAFALVGYALGPAQAAPTVRLFERETVVLRVRCLTAQVSDLPEQGYFRMAVDPATGGRLDFEVAWPGPGDRTRVTLRAEERSPRPGAPHVVRVAAESATPGGRRVEIDREIAFDESATSLFEVMRDGDRALTLAFEAVLEQETVVDASPKIGLPVRFRLEIQRIDGGGAVSLETNTMNTFVGEPVTYSFRLGAPGESESAELTLRPVRMFGDVLRVEAEVSGMLHDGESMALLSRSHDWLATSGTTSSLNFEIGAPPRGFRFLVTSVY